MKTDLSPPSEVLILPNGQLLLEKLGEIFDLFNTDEKEHELTFRSTNDEDSSWGRAKFVAGRLQSLTFFPPTVETYRGDEMDCYEFRNRPERGLEGFVSREFFSGVEAPIRTIGPIKLEPGQEFDDILGRIIDVIDNSTFKVVTDDSRSVTVKDGAFVVKTPESEVRLANAKVVAGRMLFGLGCYGQTGTSFPLSALQSTYLNDF